jgi:hypothetical protein
MIRPVQKKSQWFPIIVHLAKTKKKARPKRTWKKREKDPKNNSAATATSSNPFPAALLQHKHTSSQSAIMS